MYSIYWVVCTLSTLNTSFFLSLSCRECSSGAARAVLLRSVRARTPEASGHTPAAVPRTLLSHLRPAAWRKPGGRGAPQRHSSTPTGPGQEGLGTQRPECPCDRGRAPTEAHQNGKTYSCRNYVQS